MTGRCPAKGLMCLLATSVGPLLYSLQHLPFHFTERAHTHTQWHRQEDVHMQTQTDRQDDGCTHIYTSTHYFSFYTSPLSKLPAVSYHLFVPSKNPTDIWTPETCSFSLCKDTHTHTPFPIHSVGQQVYWILMISGPASPWLISGCRFSVVYLILSFCLHPSIVSPHSPAFVKNEGGHLPSVAPSPSSLSSQTTVEASVRLWKGRTLFACVHVYLKSIHDWIFGPNVRPKIAVWFAQGGGDGGVKAHLPFGTHTAIVSELNMILHK